MKAGKIIAILVGALILAEVLLCLVHQVIMEVPYSKVYLTVPVFFACFIVLYCFMGYKSMRHSANTRFLSAYKTIKILAAVLFIASYVMMAKTKSTDTGFLIRFFVEYSAMLVAETYIYARLQARVLSKNSTGETKSLDAADKEK